eukprot:253627_1
MASPFQKQSERYHTRPNLKYQFPPKFGSPSPPQSQSQRNMHNIANHQQQFQAMSQSQRDMNTMQHAMNNNNDPWGGSIPPPPSSSAPAFPKNALQNDANPVSAPFIVDETVKKKKKKSVNNNEVKAPPPFQ